MKLLEKIKNGYCPFEDNDPIVSLDTGKEYAVNSAAGERISVMVAEPFEENRHYCFNSLEDALEFIQKEEEENV